MKKFIKCRLCSYLIQKKGRHHFYCDICRKIRDKQSRKKWISLNPEKDRECHNRYNHSISKEKRRENKRIAYARYPERVQARNYARATHQRGKICSKCNSKDNLHFHHTDYKKREGMTLCKECHLKLHIQLKKVSQNFTRRGI